MNRNHNINKSLFRRTLIYLFIKEFQVIIKKISILIASILTFSFIVIQLFRAPINYWKLFFTVFLLLVLAGLVYFFIKSPLFYSKKHQSSLVKRFILEHITQGEKYFVLNELKNEKKNNPLTELAIERLLNTISADEIKSYFRILQKSLFNWPAILSFFSVILFSFFLLANNQTLYQFWFHPFQKNSGYRLTVIDLTSPRKIIFGDSIYFKVRTNQRMNKLRAEILDLSGGKIIQTIPLFGLDSMYQSEPFVPSASFYYRYSGIPEIHFSGNDYIHSKTFFVRVKHVPDLKFIEFKVIPPHYMHSDPVFWDGNENIITVPEYSTLVFRGEFTDSISTLLLRTNLYNEKDLTDHLHNFVFSDTLNQVKKQITLNFYFTIPDFHRRFKHPIEYLVKLEKDQFPRISLLYPTENSFLDENLSSTFRLFVKDDYGIDKIFLHKIKLNKRDSIISQMKVDITRLTGIKEKEQNLSFKYSFFNDFLLPGEKMIVYFSVKDNNPYRKQISYSDSIKLLVPSIENELNKLSNSMDSVQAKEANILENIKNNLSQLEEVKKDLLKKETLNWEEKDKIKQISDRLKKLEQEMKEISNAINKSLETMTKNKLLNEETLQKYQQLQRMFLQLANEELKQLMQKLNEAIQKENFKEKKNAFENAEFSLEEFQKKIERLYELFKKAEIERKLKELTSLFQKMEESVSKLLEDLKQNTKEHIEATKKINHLKEKNQFLEQYLKNLIENSHQAQQLALEKKLNEVLEEFKNAQTNENFDLSKLMIEQKHKNVGSIPLQKNKETYNRMTTELRNIAEDFLQSQKKNLLYEIKRLIRELLQLSYKQEKINEEIVKMARFSKSWNKILLQQNDLYRWLQVQEKEALKITKQSFLTNPIIYEFIHSARLNLEKIIKDIEERRMFQIRNQTNATMKNLNLAIYLLIKSHDKIAKSESGTGLEEFMQQMEKMAQQQAGINQKSMELFNQMQKGRLSPAQRQMVQQLRAQQEAIERSMEYLKAQRAGSNGQGEKQIKGIQEEIKKIVEDLKRYKLDRKLIERQRRVLNRMLSATHSLQEKDLSKKREAEVGKEYEVTSPELQENEIFYRNEVIEMIKYIQQMELDEFTKKSLINYYEKLLQNY